MFSWVNWVGRTYLVVTAGLPETTGAACWAGGLALADPTKAAAIRLAYHAMADSNAGAKQRLHKVCVTWPPAALLRAAAFNPGGWTQDTDWGVSAPG